MAHLTLWRPGSEAQSGLGGNADTTKMSPAAPRDERQDDRSHEGQGEGSGDETGNRQRLHGDVRGVLSRPGEHHEDEHEDGEQDASPLPSGRAVVVADLRHGQFLVA